MSEAVTLWTGGVETDAPGGTWAGLYLYLDLAGHPPLGPTFDAVALRMLAGFRKQAPLYDQRLAWAILILGLESGEQQYRLGVKAHYNEMWARHAELCEQLLQGEPAFAVWFVDRQGRPFDGLVCGKREGEEVLLLAPDVRETDLYRRLLAEAPVSWHLALWAVEPATLQEGLAKRP